VESADSEFREYCDGFSEFGELSFTNENGKINDYKIVGEYLIHRDDVYHIENREALDELEKMLE
jgi:hypothetical protein